MLEIQAVSYTHLMSKYGFSILFMGFELWLSFAAFFWPVSYTHLDVYKRQPLRLTEMSMKLTR